MTLYELWLHSMINRYDVSLHQLYCCVIDLQTSTELNSYIVVLECFFWIFFTVLAPYVQVIVLCFTGQYQITVLEFLFIVQIQIISLLIRVVQNVR